MSLLDASTSRASACFGDPALIASAAQTAVAQAGVCEVHEGHLRLPLQPVHGAAVCEVRIAWRLHGPADAPCVAVLGGISADRQVSGPTGWWLQQTGEGGALDTRHWRVLGIDWLDAEQLGAPAVETSDQAQALAGVLDALRIPRLHALVGASYGAMVGLAFAVRDPQRVARLIAIAGAHRPHPLAAALRAVQREIVRLALDGGDAARGVALARQLAMIGYRSPRELGKRFAAAPTLTGAGVRVAAQDWLDAAGQSFARRFEPQRFVALSESIDLHRIAPEDVRVPTTLIGFGTDQLVPLADLCALQRGLGAPCELHVLDSDYGHDAFLKEHVTLGALLRAALAQTETCRA